MPHKMAFSFWHLVGSENTINKNFSIYESPIFADLIVNLAYFIWIVCTIGPKMSTLGKYISFIYIPLLGDCRQLAIFICQGILYINILCLSACLLIHSCMPIPLVPDPIRVQSCVCCLFWTIRNSNIYLSIYLIIQLEIWILQLALSVNGNIYFYWNYIFVRNKQSGFVKYSF